MLLRRQLPDWRSSTLGMSHAAARLRFMNGVNNIHSYFGGVDHRQRREREHPAH